MDPIETHPVQTNKNRQEAARVPKPVAMKAYEVYCHLYAPQTALVTGDCRGGFGANELIAFLYAAAFPKDQWRARADEAFAGMTGI